MTNHRNSLFCRSYDGSPRQAKTAAHEFRASKNFIVIAYLRLSRLQNLPVRPFATAGVR